MYGITKRSITQNLINKFVKVSDVEVVSAWKMWRWSRSWMCVPVYNMNMSRSLNIEIYMTHLPNISLDW